MPYGPLSFPTLVPRLATVLKYSPVHYTIVFVVTHEQFAPRNVDTAWTANFPIANHSAVPTRIDSVVDVLSHMLPSASNFTSNGSSPLPATDTNQYLEYGVEFKDLNAIVLPITHIESVLVYRHPMWVVKLSLNTFQ